jgi:hypothetical protein
MEQLHHRSRWPVAILILSLLLLLVVLLMAAGKQVTLPMTGIQSNRQVMPPDPEDWCRKVKADKLDAEIAKAELFFSEGVGENLVDWRYLRRALKYTGVQVNGPEDTFWLETIRSLYSGCSP